MPQTLAMPVAAFQSRRAPVLLHRTFSGALLLVCCAAGWLGAIRAASAPLAWGVVARRPARARVPRWASVDGVEIAGELAPLASYALVKPREAVSMTKGGILLPDSGKEKPTEGEVLSVGPGDVNEDTGARMPVYAKPGMKVMYGKYGAEKIQYNDEEHLLVSDSDVLLSYDGDEPTLENIKMPYGKVLIQLKEKDTESESGLMLSAGLAKPDTTVGTVMVAAEGSVNAKGELVPLEISTGDVVRFRYGSEVKLEVGKSEYRVVDTKACLARWKE